ncbi:MAG: cupin domain-containing protein [Candidatus Korobacteraceae bacterium]|jgi:quercetin dioxygenase-like cupin family protein
MDYTYDCTHVVEVEQEPRHHLVFSNEFVRGFAVEIAPHERSLCHHHPNDYLLYVALSAEIISAARDEEPKQLSYSDGECELLEAGLVHVVENLSDTPFRNVVVELLPSADELRRGAEPDVIRGEATVTRIFDDERAAIFSLAIEPGAEIEVSGPAVVATPYGNKLNPDAIGDIEVKPNRICDLAWIPPQREAVLWGCWEGSERAIVFQVGATNEEFSVASKSHEPLRSLHAHADKPE